MNCRGCGIQISDDSVFCQYCGHSIAGQARPSQQQLQAKSGMSVVWIVVIVIVAIVLITTVLAAVLYFMVLGFGSSVTATPSAMYAESPIANGEEIRILWITKPDVPWSDVTVQLTDETNIAEWEPSTANLDGGDAVSSNLTVDFLGSLIVCCVVHDDRGDGYVSGSDYFRLYTYNGASTFASTTWYTAVLVYEPTGEPIGLGQTFRG